MGAFRFRGLVLGVIAVTGAVATGGCARADNAAERHASEMRESITKLQADQDRLNERLANLEIAAADARAGKPATSTAAPGTVVPPPRTVSIGEQEPADEDPNDPSARPDIRLVGTPGAARPTRGKTSSGRGEARVEPADHPDLGSDRPRTSGTLDPDAKRAYESALGLVNAKQYDRGLEAFAAFLVRWPDHPYAENAMYWRGEAYFAKGEYGRAAEQFEAVLARFSATGNKTPDALLKLGMCHERLGAEARAKETWERLKRDYPRSDAAKKVPNSTRESGKGDRGRAVK